MISELQKNIRRAPDSYTVLYCPVCKVAYAVHLDESEVNSILSKTECSFPCITSLCRGRLSSVEERNSERVFVTASKVIPVTVDDFYRAAAGGMVGPVPKEEVDKVLVGSRISSVRGYSAGDPERTIIETLVLEDGTVLHFAPSTKGACIYRIEKIEEDDDSKGTVEGDNPN